MKNLSLCFIIMIWIFFCCCKPYIIPLKTQKIYFQSSIIKTNGFYYCKNSPFTFIPYKNGILIWDNAYTNTSISNKQEIEQRWVKGIYTQDIYNRQYYWGLFNIKSPKITLEYWVFADNCICPFEKEGKILNDSTLLFDIAYHSPSNLIPKLDTFRFQQLSVKPDSTNRFLK